MSIVNEMYQNCFTSQCLVEKKRVCLVLGDVMSGFQHPGSLLEQSEKGRDSQT